MGIQEGVENNLMDILEKDNDYGTDQRIIESHMMSHAQSNR